MGLRSWLARRFERPSRRRAVALGAVAVVLLAVALMGLVNVSSPHLTVDDQRPQGNTLIGLQGYHDEGRVIEVDPSGDVVWKYTNVSNVFDVEALGPHRVQVAGSDELPDDECPARYRNDSYDGCAHNTVRIVDPRTDDVTWEYGWYDVERHNHELHDVDHYTVDGADRWVLVDMGNDRVFAIDRTGAIQWQWNANSTYRKPAKMGPEADWTHVNDVDRLRKGVFQISLRNFDTVANLTVAPNGSTSISPVIGPNHFTPNGYVGPLAAQHNPDRLADGHLLVADSEDDRVVEFSGKKQVWAFGGNARLDWPRDADRLRDGNTLITDSYHGRVLEVDSKGTVVWAVQTGRLPYEADRLPANETGEGSRPRPVASGASGFASRTNTTDSLVANARFGLTLVKYAVPGWAGYLAVFLGGVVFGVGALFETRRWRRA